MKLHCMIQFSFVFKQQLLFPCIAKKGSCSIVFFDINNDFDITGINSYLFMLLSFQ